MRIWFPKPLGDDVIDRLQSLVPGHPVSKEFSADAEILIEGRPERGQLESSPRLKAVIVPFAGVSPSLADLMREFPKISLHNLHHNAPDTAETAVTLLMAAAKRTIPMDQSLRRNDWSPRYEPSNTLLLSGRTAVILGYGEVGKRIGRILRALEMQVIGVRRSSSDGSEGVRSVAELDAVLPLAQALIITVPLTPETENMIGEREMGLMPEQAILINVARAQIVDEKALYDALKSGRLHSAGSDVWYRYPAEEGTAVPTYFTAPPSAKNTPPANFPFGELDNMVLSPHRGGATWDTERRRVEHLALLLQAAVKGDAIPNRVDLDRGY